LKVILFLGYSSGGKTTALISLSKLIAKSNLGKVGTLKHIHKPNFTIDKKGKDTWKHAKSGASIVVALSPRELVVLKKSPPGFRADDMSAKELLRIFQRENVDYLLVEGLHAKFSGSRGVYRIICASTEKETLDLLAENRLDSREKRNLCITGKFVNYLRRRASGKEAVSFKGIPLVKIPEETCKILQLTGVR
jgi:molybdopterin-guanine dinucleotide biosynthesis protein MobB